MYKKFVNSIERFAMINSDINNSLHLRAVEAIDSGNIRELRKILEDHPEIVRERFDSPEEGYFKNPYLLWFIADNPIRHPGLPENIVEITTLIIKYAKKEAPDSFQYQLDYTLELVATGSIPRKCGVQIELIDLLIESGATAGDLLGTVAHGNVEAAEHLLKKGGQLNLAVAICINRQDAIPGLLENANKEDKQLALMASAFYGKPDMLSLLLKNGADASGYIQSSSRFHSHATPLHQAVSSGSLNAVKVLIDAGARLDLKDKIYEGTPEEWARYMRTETENEETRNKYREIENYLQSLAS